MGELIRIRLCRLCVIAAEWRHWRSVVWIVNHDRGAIGTNQHESVAGAGSLVFKRCDVIEPVRDWKRSHRLTSARRIAL